MQVNKRSIFKNRVLVRTGLILAPLVLSSCSSLFGNEGYFRDRGDDYLKADSLPEMQLPDQVPDQKVDQLYAIPAMSATDTELAEEFEVPRPQPLSENAFTDRVKIQRLSGKQWILVSAPPAQVWPQVRAFLSRYNLEVAYTNAATGIIETGWLKFKGDEEGKDRYRLRIEQGVQPDSAEIHVLHMSARADAPDTQVFDWPVDSHDNEREQWMRDELAGTLATDKSGSQAASLMAQTIGLSDKVKLDTSGSEPVLRMNLALNRAWATIGHAVGQEGFRIWDKDSAAGVYYVYYDPELVEDAKPPGFWARLFGAGGVKEPETSPYGLSEILDHLHLSSEDRDLGLFKPFDGISDDRLEQIPGLLVVLVQKNKKIEVRIRDGYARPLEFKEARKRLNTIRHNLI